MDFVSICHQRPNGWANLGRRAALTQSMQHTSEQLVERAKNLFEFLARAQQLKVTPARSTDAYERDGKVIWFESLPEHPAVATSHRGGDPGPDTFLFAVD